MSEMLGERIRRLRLARGLTQRALGRLCGLSDTSLRLWEDGTYMPKGQYVAALARFLDVSTDLLLTGREAPHLAALHAAIRRGATNDVLLAMVVRHE